MVSTSGIMTERKPVGIQLLDGASFSCPRHDRVTPPLEEIARIWTALRLVDCHYIATFIGDVPLLATRRVDWNFLEAAIAFWNPSRAVLNIQGTELTPTIEEYQTLIGRTAVVHGIIESNFHTARQTLVSRLLGVPMTRLNAEIAYSGSTEIAIEKLLLFIESRAHRVQGDFLRKDLCHVVLLLIFGTLLFPRSHSLIDAALASVVLQVVGERGYEIALVVETVRSLDRILRTRDRRITGSHILLQFWFQNHANPFSLVRSVMYFNGPKSIISRLLSLIVPEDTAQAGFEHTWWEDQTSVDRQRDIERVLDSWRTVVIERPYFPKHPTLEEWDFQATEEYVPRFYRWGPTTHEDSADSSRAEDSGPTGASLTPNRKTSSLWISDNYRKILPRPASSYRGTSRSWHERMSPCKGSGSEPVEVHASLRLDASTKSSLGSVLSTATVTRTLSAVEERLRACF
ncbi:hypothetical protein CRG98_017285 [Punica granatum]|uniref:DUF7745 domain-containing protein n=1 Tax=Punica granatum TaxID=22663 RepID=A0A2I0K151_PUNGR|nr:hypothetical protein CRG98_017285 [Punica granatum]